MAGTFFDRLRSYFLQVASVLRGEASAASVFPNTTDIGVSRELIYAEFLRQHAPSKCNVFLGGFLFGNDGSESGQLDVIVTTDTAPRFDFLNQGGQGKSFSPVEGTLAVASIKSSLDKRELEDSLRGMAAIPPAQSLEKRVAFGVKIREYEDWPYKIIYASKGISSETLLQHLHAFYEANSQIPLARRPNIIHVSGEYIILKATEFKNTIWEPQTGQETSLPLGTFVLLKNSPDLQGIVRVLEALQERATASTHILYSYTDFINRIVGIT